MGTKSLVFIFLFLFSLSFISAVPPVQTSEIVDKGISIEAPIIEFVKAGELFKYHIHTYNATDGTRLTNTSVSCMIHLYDSNGGHLITDTMGFDSNGVDFKYDVLGGNFTEGQHAVLFDCQNGGIGGFLEYPFTVTTTGEESNLQNILAYVILLIFFCSLILGLVALRNKIDFEKWYDKIQKKDRTYIQSSLAVIPYTFMKNVYLIYYLLAFPIIFLIGDITSVYTIESIAYMFNIFSRIYTVGMVIPGLIFLGEMIKILVDMWENFQKKNWGLDE